MAARKKAQTEEFPLPSEITGEAAVAPQAVAPQAAPSPQQEDKKKARKKKERIIFTRGKRKCAIARASVRKGKGLVRVNRFSLNSIQDKYFRRSVQQPLELGGPVAQELDFDVHVKGGGPMGQAEAVRMAIARGIVEWSNDPELKQKMIQFDRHLLIEDSRRVEPKKYKGPKARARFQKSYR